jgi:hypothetical protein
MLLNVDQAPWIYRVLASFFTWLLLAGVLIFPGVLTSLRNPNALNGMNRTGKTILKTVQNLPLLVIAGSCCFCGATGIFWAWKKGKRENIILVNQLFLQVTVGTSKTIRANLNIRRGLLNSVAGLIKRLINIYTAQDGYWSATAIATTVVIGICAITTLIPYSFYEKRLQAIRRHYNQERPHIRTP